MVLCGFPEIGRSLVLVDEMPTGCISRVLFNMGILRPRPATQQYPKMLVVERILFGISTMSILLGLINFVSARQCTAFAEEMRQKACDYNEHMAILCVVAADNITGCTFENGCGGKNYVTCGGKACSRSFCLDSFVQYLGAADPGALKQWRHIDDEILSIQALGSGVAKSIAISLPLFLHLSIHDQYSRS